MRRIGHFVFVAALAVGGCSTTEADCDAAFNALKANLVDDQKLPKNADEAAAKAAAIEQAIAGWDKTKAGLKDDGVRNHGDAMHATLQQHAAVLRGLKFDPPNPTPVASAAPGSATRKEALEAAAGLTVDALLGGLSKASLDALSESQQKADEARVALVDWCMDNS